jgi:non-ribosomal peptide synthetase component F
MLAKRAIALGMLTRLGARSIVVSSSPATITQVVEHRVGKSGDATAVVFTGKDRVSLTYSELDAQSKRLAVSAPSDTAAAHALTCYAAPPLRSADWTS